jgi:hypothetical protein
MRRRIIVSTIVTIGTILGTAATATAGVHVRWR